ncbi:Histone H1-beta, late embryonic [Araneus ventricosus]|uniref:Histone H1-beta, late embryonic n=1 Tax=Araneus ventricosus TaxID=182803 RepID=A0A4Y2LR89_ARAVE|nr:Histone H1-beta, late embryonic [Araneus ventricosus]
MAANSTTKHPKVSEMVLLSIAMLNDRNGSSVQAIKKYISSNFNVEEKKISAYVKRYLLMAVASGTIIQTKGKGAAGSFRLGGGMKLKMSELLSKFPNEHKAVPSSSHTEEQQDSQPTKRGRKPKKTKTDLKATSRAI